MEETIEKKSHKRKTPRPKLLPLVVGPQQAADLLSERLDKVYAKINSGELPSYLDGRLRRIPVAAIEALIQRRLQEAQQPNPYQPPK